LQGCETILPNDYPIRLVRIPYPLFITWDGLPGQESPESRSLTWRRHSQNGHVRHAAGGVS
jgi:hypothetical protein